MTVEVRELHTSRDVNLNDGILRGLRRFFVFEDTGEIAEPVRLGGEIGWAYGPHFPTEKEALYELVAETGCEDPAHLCYELICISKETYTHIIKLSAVIREQRDQLKRLAQ